MKILLISILVVGMIIPVYADSFEGVDNENFVFLEINGDKATANMRIDGKLNSISGDIKYYDGGGFKIKSDSNDRILLYGTPKSDESLQIIIIDLTERKKTVINLEKLSNVFLIPKRQEHEGMPHIETLLKEEGNKLQAKIDAQRLEEISNKKPRSVYTKDENRKIAILDQMPLKVSVYSFFDFDIRIVDADKNNLYSYYNTDGYIDDAVIFIEVKDGDGNTLNEFTGYTTKDGHYAPDEVTSFENNINTRNAFSFDVSATVYFDDTETYITTSLFKEFFVYVPSDLKPICKPGFVLIAGGICELE